MTKEDIIKEQKEYLIKIYHKKLIDTEERDDRAGGHRILAKKYWPEEFLDGKRKEVHHIDFDHNNNAVSNLVVLTRSEHKKIHYLFDPKYKETRRKIAEGNKGKYISEETRRKIAEAAHNMSEEQRRKIAESNHNRNISEETRRKMSEAMKKYCAERKALQTQEQKTRNS